MRYSINYVPSAAKALTKLDRVTARRVFRAIESLAIDPRPQGSVQLKGGEGERRIRVGDFRVVYEIHDDEILILVLRVGHRREIYR